MEDDVKLFENKINNNLFKFLVREYFAQSMNPFRVLKLLSKILSFKISKLLKLKYILLFLTILKRLTINESVFTGIINPIINETVSDILTRKADFVIIIQYAIFLVQIKQIDFAISRLQIFSTDPRFMNNGELIFYRGIISYISNPDNKSYINLFEKGLPLIKKNSNIYCEWLLNFLIFKNQMEELGLFLKQDKIKESLAPHKKFSLFLNALTDTDYIDNFKKIIIIAEELNSNFIHFNLILHFRDLIDSYYMEHNSSQDNTKFLLRLIYVNENYFLTYLNFLYTTFLFDYYNSKCINLLEEILIDIHYCLENHINFLNEENDNRFKSLMYENIKYLIEILIKDKICKNILKISGCLRNDSNSKKLTENIETIRKILKLVDFNHSILYGIGFSQKYKLNLNKKSLFLDYEYTKNFIKSIKKINY